MRSGHCPQVIAASIFPPSARPAAAAASADGLFISTGFQLISDDGFTRS